MSTSNHKSCDYHSQRSSSSRQGLQQNHVHLHMLCTTAKGTGTSDQTVSTYSVLIKHPTNKPDAIVH